MSPRDRRWIGAGYATVASGVVIRIVQEVAANQLGTLGRWVPWAVVGVGSVFCAVLWIMRYLRRPATRIAGSLAPPLPRGDDLIGRERTVEAVVDRARSDRVVVVHGPDGIGDSSVAILAARLLVPGESAQRYVDLRGERPNDVRSARLHVLRTLGLETRNSGTQAAQAVRTHLTDSGLVLLIDNVSGVRQVAWIAEAVPGAYIIIAGDIRTDELPGVADVPVQGLDPADALDLLRRQDAESPQGRLGRIRDRVLGVRRHSIDARIIAERDAAEELAKHYLQHPRVVIQLGRWLARNPDERISAVLNAVEEGGEVFELQVIMRRSLEGLSPGGRRLLALLVAVPDLEFPDSAVAELASTSVERASEHLGELGDRFMVHLSSSGSRIAPQAVNLVEKLPDKAVAKARTRLIAHYAGLAARGADLLGAEQWTEAAHWFAAHDVTLRGLLSMPDPARAAARHLWEIADALDLWFARERRNLERWNVAEMMRDRAGELGDTAAQAVALVRLAAISRRRRMLDESRKLLGGAEALTHGRTPWLPQLKTEWALHHLSTGDLDAARNDLLRAQVARPQRDVHGRMTDLINLAVVEIRLRQYGPAADRLEEAARLAERAGSTAGRAHALELVGVARRSQGHTSAADDAWTEAESLYRSIGDFAARERCERHRAVAQNGRAGEGDQR